MMKYLFPGFLICVTILLSLGSYLFRDSREAMTAIVDAQVTAISFEDPVVVSKIHVVAGQQVKKGQILVNVENPQLELKIDRYKGEIAILNQELVADSNITQDKSRVLRLKYNHKVEALEDRLAVLQLKLTNAQELSSRLASLGGDSISSDLRLLLAERETLLNAVDHEKNEYSSELKVLKSQSSARTELLRSKLLLKETELKKAIVDQSQLVQYAGFDGTVGTVNVQLGELTAPFKKLITIYESQPTLIKAFLNERITYEVNVGDTVSVLAENRSYESNGVVIEIGNRIAPFPDKINTDPLVKNYGQEVFIRISPENKFLNGEKVFAEPISN